MNKFLVNIATVFFITTNPLLDSIQPYFPHQVEMARPQLTQFATYPREAQEALNALNKLPEFRELLAKVQRDGPVHLRMEPHNNNFEGLWDGNKRHVVINTKFNPKLGAMICTILFELHNADTIRYYDHLIDQARAGQLTKDQYVEKVELAEYKNAKNTQMLLEKGIKMGIFPESARWPIMPNFEDHYKVQQVSGHSLFIAKNYDLFHPRGSSMPFKGTISRPAWMNQQDIDDLCHYIVMGAGLNSGEKETVERWKKALKNEVAILSNAYNSVGDKKHIERNPRRVVLINIALKGNPDFHQETKDKPFLTT